MQLDYIYITWITHSSCEYCMQRVIASMIFSIIKLYHVTQMRIGLFCNLDPLKFFFPPKVFFVSILISIKLLCANVRC